MSCAASNEGDVVITQAVTARTENGVEHYNQYRIDGCLGDGTHSAVELATSAGRKFALKRFLRDELQNQTVPRFTAKGMIYEKLEDSVRREIDIFMLIRPHPNVARLLEVFDAPEHPLLLLYEHLDGQLMYWSEDRWTVTRASPDEVEISHKVFTPSAALSNLRHIWSGLQYLHARQVLHKDLKPSNLGISHAFSDAQMWSPLGLEDELLPPQRYSRPKRPKYDLDYLQFLPEDTSHGRPVVKILDLGSSEISTSNGMIWGLIGTMEFRSPESFSTKWHRNSDGSAVSYDGFKHDIWSLGVTLYCMLFGVPPLGRGAKTNMASQLDIIEGEVQYPVWFVQIVDSRKGSEAATLLHALRGLLAKDPEGRIFCDRE